MKKMTTKSNLPILYSFYLIIALLLTSCQQSPQQLPGKISEVIDRAKLQFCPDRRLAVFDIAPVLVDGQWVLRGEVDNPEAKGFLRREFMKFPANESVELQVSLLPDSTVGEKKWGLITVSVGNVRAQPGYASELVNQAMMGTFIEILQKQGGWYYARVADGYLGWLNGTFFEKMTLQEKQAWRQGRHFAFCKLSGKIYENPDPGSVIKSDVVGGNILKVISRGHVGRSSNGRVTNQDMSVRKIVKRWNDGKIRGQRQVGRLSKPRIVLKGCPIYGEVTAPKVLIVRGLRRRYLSGTV